MPETTGTTIQIEAQETGFERSGVTTQQITHGINGAGPTIQTAMGQVTPVQATAFTPTAIAGLTQLIALYNPSTDYETATNAVYDRALALAVAYAKTGDVSVRGGTTRVAYATSDALTQAGINRFREVYNALLGWAKVTLESVAEINSINRAYDQSILVANEQSIMAQHAFAQSALGYLSQVNALNYAQIQAYTAARHYGTTLMSTEEALTGKGTQDSAAKNAFGSSSFSAAGYR